ncbi:MAG: hypothetical protein Q8908_14950, partial [Bacteroidota bacterium]|nr:hypothetical protein [Bacteroidota bacterium]
MKENTKVVPQPVQNTGEAKKEEKAKIAAGDVMPGLSSDVKELEELIQRVKNAQKIYRTYSQEQVDEIFRKAAFAA